mmetsp:Transcript_40453/g.72698  ORF Transcript_40453/g.72698 Transcript_40453/m.72698 type:complete len:329 (-) Transcript_40453:72-1058(-)|eukprot:CAMPEP_0197654234 /NCGR_PEP_ID=MMETSP1338-20131121/38729_1 /TAXON_ID=43686 ORGANISM="Pelagodinium beii, Strain RCC1491" /NCGR_SAMPLE_ID=MMETSP1338 /ASSEMBLY_ACC=CAM_ASM_000754 /LENGTH=328 /DNA_ID=CAMNT_0043229641 /DNA_START=31 /DNA_END=1017 /DNA_ORIENTATION=+
MQPLEVGFLFGGFSSPNTNRLAASKAASFRKHGRPSSLHAVAEGVLLPRGKAVCLAPLRALLALASLIGLRPAKPRSPNAALKMTGPKPTSVKKEGCEASAPETYCGDSSNILADISCQLAQSTGDFASIASEVFRATMKLFDLDLKSGETVATQVSELNDSCGRAFLRPGSVYQNAYRSCLNNSGAPVSAILHITSVNQFELQVKQLNSLDGGSQGWLIFRSAFAVEPVAGKPTRMRLNLHHDENVKTLEYNDQLFHAGVSFMLGTLRRATCLLMNAFSLEVDIEKHVVHCGPRAGILQKFWQHTVQLKLTEQELWTYGKEDGEGRP